MASKRNDLRIARLTDRLEKPGLTDDEVAKIKSRIEYLESRQKKA